MEADMRRFALLTCAVLMTTGAGAQTATPKVDSLIQDGYRVVAMSSLQGNVVLALQKDKYLYMCELLATRTIYETSRCVLAH
jgi:hypothetical protein